ncbi:MAG: hypothetical protein SF053_16800 [Bacteroidia bacterium]|nr:hypothetical protein [Bacteroidia bacterium]
MAQKHSANYYMRIIHRYLGFFLAGIMAVYALSGIVMVFRNTDFLKNKIVVEQQIAPNIPPNELGDKLRIRGLKVEKQENGIYHFKDGTYNSLTGEARYVKKELPYLLEKMEHLHKATTNEPLYFLNLFFGVSLLFFVISTFWMFLPSTSIFKKGLYFTLAGIVLTLIMLFV